MVGGNKSWIVELVPPHLPRAPLPPSKLDVTSGILDFDKLWKPPPNRDYVPCVEPSSNYTTSGGSQGYLLRLPLIEEQLGKLVTDDPSIVETSLAKYGDIVYPDRASALHSIQGTIVTVQGKDRLLVKCVVAVGIGRVIRSLLDVLLTNSVIGMVSNINNGSRPIFEMESVWVGSAHSVDSLTNENCLSLVQSNSVVGDWCVVVEFWCVNLILLLRNGEWVCSFSCSIGGNED
ncbi:O-fucosyltransferase 7 [Camellia lanceoleosa]|uniref:O-fucosyltransferase 7 n=1 Tax=Camellia lanceoleosa TaxID=1840588 RepID=A0ACC0GLH1_9ERIC|nr:O-fucosyltransferase 7 [Camellia lanceoleosa]